MPNVLRIKRSTGSSAPTSLANAELAFSEGNAILYYGTGTGGAGGSATSIIQVGGLGAFLGLGSGNTQTAAGTYTFSGSVTCSGTTAIGAATATSPSVSDDSTRVATTEWVKDQGYLTSASNGTVTSVALSLPNIFTVSGSPVTTSGTLTGTLASQTANYVFAGPTTGSAAAPTFRALVAADIPDISATYLTLTGTRTASGTYTFSGTVNLSGTWQVNGTSVTADGAEINVLDGATAGSAVASKAVVLDANKDFNFGTGDVSCTDLTTTGNCVIGGNLTVNGTTTTINATSVSVDDINIVLGDTASPSDATADGGGITLKGTTDKTLNWVDATDAWTSSEHLNLLTGKEFKINGTSVLSATTLGSGVTGSSLTSLGTVTTGTWSATAIGVTKGGTGLTAIAKGCILAANDTNTLTAVDGGGSTDKLLLYTASTDTISWTNEVDCGSY